MSLWLNSGVPATEVARRAGHSVAVLLKVYAHCIDGQADAANKRIADALGGTGDSQDDQEPWRPRRTRASPAPRPSQSQLHATDALSRAA